MKIIAVATSKGGTGKTTTCVNLGYGLTKLDKKVLILDCDKQGNISNYFNLTSSKTLATFLDNIESGIDIIAVRKNLHIINSGKERLAETEKRLVGARLGIMAMNKAFKTIFESINSYDYTFLDLGPSLSLVNENALAMCDEIFIPASMGFFDLTGISQIIKIINDISDTVRPERPIKVCGMFVNMFDKRTKIAETIEANLRAAYKNLVFKTKVRKNVSIAEAPAFHEPVQTYEPGSHGDLDFTELAEEFLDRA